MDVQRRQWRQWRQQNVWAYLTALETICLRPTRRSPTLLCNALKIIGRLPEGTSGKPLSAFADAGDIASWAKEAMTLLVERGTIEGYDGKLYPLSISTRAEMAQVLYNMLSK